MDSERDTPSGVSAPDTPTGDPGARPGLGCLGWLGWLAVGAVMIYAGCTWDGYVADYRFEKLCSEPGAIGQFIYERVGLDESFFTEPVIREDGRREKSYYDLPDGSLIDETRFTQHFEIKVYERTRVSDIGTIYLMHSTVTRKSDGALLGEARNYENRGGKSRDAWSLGYWHETCPTNKPDEINTQSEFRKIHRTLVENIFFKQSK